jgi:TetR/AcrR family transcriptional repressor of bet genes
MTVHSLYGMLDWRSGRRFREFSKENGRMAEAVPADNRRTRARAARRRQLIDATMKCIARKGMRNTTLGDVAREAGLSQGIVNLHFESKDNLLNETLRSLANDYREQFDRTLERAAPDPASQLQAIMELDIRPSVCDRQKLAIWFAFWGEVKTRPAYRDICGALDKYYDEVVERLCAALIEDGGYTGVSPGAASDALTAMSYGFWLSCLVSPQTWDRQEALEAIMSYLRNVFPRHYS